MAQPRHEALYRDVIHPALALASPAIGVPAAASMAEDLLARDVLTPVFVLAVGVAALAEVVIGNLVAAHRGGWQARLREFLLVAGLSYLLFNTLDLHGSAGGERVWASARAVPILQTAGVAVCWFAVNRRHAAFRPREDFLRSVRGRRGRDLRHRMRETRGFATDILLRLREINTSAGLAFGLLLLATGVVWASQQSLSARSFALFVAHGSVMIVQAAVVNSFRQEFAVYGEGIAVPTRFLRRLATSAGLVVVLALVVSLPFARSASPLSPRAFVGLLEALRGWFAALPEAELPTPPSFSLPPMQDLLGNYGISADQLELARFWEAFARIFRTVVLVTGALLTTAFVLWPLFSRHFRRLVGRARIGRRIMLHVFGLVGLLLTALRVLAHGMRSLLRLAMSNGGKASADSDLDTAGPEEGRRRSAAPAVPRSLRRQRGVVEHMLARLFEEGTKKGAPWEPSVTPREYSRLLTDTYPELESPLSTVVKTAETAFYSPHKLHRRQLQSFKAAARAAVATLEED